MSVKQLATLYAYCMEVSIAYCSVITVNIPFLRVYSFWIKRVKFEL